MQAYIYFYEDSTFGIWLYRFLSKLEHMHPPLILRTFWQCLHNGVYADIYCCMIKDPLWYYGYWLYCFLGFGAKNGMGGWASGVEWMGDTPQSQTTRAPAVLKTSQSTIIQSITTLKVRASEMYLLVRLLCYKCCCCQYFCCCCQYFEYNCWRCCCSIINFPFQMQLQIGDTQGGIRYDFWLMFSHIFYRKGTDETLQIRH